MTDKRCRHCGKPVPRERAVFCDKNCQAAYNSREAGTGHPRRIPGKTCVECSGPIPWRAGQASRDTARFCGNLCKFAWQRRPENAPNYAGALQVTTCQAPGCGQEFSYYPSVQPNATACSPACRSALHSVKMTGRRPSKGVYAGKESFRIAARQEFFDRCSLCGWAEAPCDVAHIVSRKDGGTDMIGNVTMLCPNHHRMFDCGLIPAEMVLEARASVLKHQPSLP